ncbi:predicted signal-transduction protein containing cAMP-binding and CBS domains [Vibrio astriarenae]|nr:predicted signal-transduction protein containing cAMP-binding and CBS domains [Vibrio sp. C7]
MGSMGRDEQLIVTDQDNAIILDDDYNEEKHGAYFEKFANSSVMRSINVVTPIVLVTSWQPIQIGA